MRRAVATALAVILILTLASCSFNANTPEYLARRAHEETLALTEATVYYEAHMTVKRKHMTGTRSDDVSLTKKCVWTDGGYTVYDDRGEVAETNDSGVFAWEFIFPAISTDGYEVVESSMSRTELVREAILILSTEELAAYFSERVSALLDAYGASYADLTGAGDTTFTLTVDRPRGYARTAILHFATTVTVGDEVCPATISLRFDYTDVDYEV